MTDPSHTPDQNNFVTTLAWVIIVLAGIATVMLTAQNLFMHFIFAPGELERLMGAQQGMSGDAPVHRFMAENFRLLMVIPLLFAALALIGAIGLLGRRPWGYGLIIVMMAVGVLWNGAAVVLHLMTIMGVGGLPGPVLRPGMFGGGFQMLVSALLIPVFVWIIVRLRAPEIRKEFGLG
jgi:hypothetical protein